MGSFESVTADGVEGVPSASGEAISKEEEAAQRGVAAPLRRGRRPPPRLSSRQPQGLSDTGEEPGEKAAPRGESKSGRVRAFEEHLRSERLAAAAPLAALQALRSASKRFRPRPAHERLRQELRRRFRRLL